MKIYENNLIAEEGYVLTNGSVYGKKVRLGDWDSAANWDEITEEEYNKILEQQESEVM